MSDELFDDDTALMSRLGLDEDQYDKVIEFVSIITKDVDPETASINHNVSEDDILDKRYSVIRMMHLANVMIDDEVMERDGCLPTILKNENGESSVGTYSNFKLGRAVLDSFDGHLTVKECADQWGFSEEVVEYGRALYSRILLYLGAEAIKASPYLSTLGIFDRISNAEDFVQLRTIIETYLVEDDEESDTESDFESDFQVDPDED